MGKDAPKSPDPGTLAAQQALVNRLNTFTPFGNITFSGARDIPGTGKLERLPTSVRVTLDPQMEKVLNQQLTASLLLGESGIDLARRLPDRPAAGFDPTFSSPIGQFRPNAGAVPTFRPGSFEASRRAAEQAVFQRAMNLLNPELELQEERLRQRLANQGLPQASRAFTSEVGRFEDTSNRAREEAAMAAVLAGLDAQQQGFGQQLAGFGANLQGQGQRFGQARDVYDAALQRRQMQFGQDLAGFQADQAARAAQLNEILSRLGLAQVQLPQPVPTPQVDLLGANQLALSGNMAGFNAQQQLLGGILGLGGSLGSAAILAPALAGSDRRIKTNIKLVGRTFEGLPVYTFRYRSDPSGMFHMGVMAQNVLEVRPEAVATMPDGTLGVYYGRL